VFQTHAAAGRVVGEGDAFLARVKERRELEKELFVGERCDIGVDGPLHHVDPHGARQAGRAQAGLERSLSGRCFPVDTGVDLDKCDVWVVVVTLPQLLHETCPGALVFGIPIARQLHAVAHQHR
jgi:hypothetical protein